jgi:uncharacterized protein (DUF1778 family)
MKADRSTYIRFLCSRDLKRQVKRAAKETDRSMTQFCIDALKEALHAREEKQDS